MIRVFPGYHDGFSFVELVYPKVDKEIILGYREAQEKGNALGKVDGSRSSFITRRIGLDFSARIHNILSLTLA